MGGSKRRGLHGGKWVFARGEVGIARGEVGVGQGILGDCGRFSPRRGRFAVVFQGNRPENGFPVEMPVCPKCGFVYVPEELALGKVLAVERALEDK